MLGGATRGTTRHATLKVGGGAGFIAMTVRSGRSSCSGITEAVRADLRDRTEVVGEENRALMQQQHGRHERRGVLSSVAAKPLMAASGSRSSWLTSPRNSVRIVLAL